MLIDDLRSFGRDMRGAKTETIKQLLFDAADALEAAYNRAQPESFTGCQLRGPGECQSRGMCLSDACEHAGKTIRPRMCVEPKEDGVVYPSFAERNMIDRFGPKETGE